MALDETLKQTDELQSKISSHWKLSDEVLKKINYKFRLDWNYHSNAMEGNSLTKEETRSVMINNITIEGKPLKDVIEIRGHDEIIASILKIGKGEQRISEKRIKEIHKAIMHEDDPKQASKIGEWKTKENHIINYKGEKFEFVPPADVPEEIHKVINWLNAEYDEIISKKNPALHPVIVAFQFHVRYVTIHPFYDGNGRTARILMNLILIMFGYPPVIVKVSDKDTYNRYLADIQGYGGSPDLFYEFMAKLLIKSQELVLTAIEGGDIDEPDDLDKKISLLEKELSSIDLDNMVVDKFDANVFLKIYDGWLTDILNSIIPTTQKFNKFFTGIKHNISIGLTSINFVDDDSDKIIKTLRSKIEGVLYQFNPSGLVFLFESNYGNFAKGGLKTFGCKFDIVIHFEYLNYSIVAHEFKDEYLNGPKRLIDARPLYQPMTKEEINNLNKSFGETIYNFIDLCSKQQGIR
jgi:Fic family protein